MQRGVTNGLEVERGLCDFLGETVTGLLPGEGTEEVSSPGLRPCSQCWGDMPKTAAPGDAEEVRLRSWTERCQEVQGRRHICRCLFYGVGGQGGRHPTR